MKLKTKEEQHPKHKIPTTNVRKMENSYVDIQLN